MRGDNKLGLNRDSMLTVKMAGVTRFLPWMMISATTTPFYRCRTHFAHSLSSFPYFLHHKYAVVSFCSYSHLSSSHSDTDTPSDVILPVPPKQVSLFLSPLTYYFKVVKLQICCLSICLLLLWICSNSKNAIFLGFYISRVYIP